MNKLRCLQSCEPVLDQKARSSREPCPEGQLALRGCYKKCLEEDPNGRDLVAALVVFITLICAPFSLYLVLQLLYWFGRHKEVVRIDEIKVLVDQLRIEAGFDYLGKSEKSSILTCQELEYYFWHYGRRIGVIVTARFPKEIAEGMGQSDPVRISARPVCQNWDTADGTCKYLYGLIPIPLEAVFRQIRVFVQLRQGKWRPLYYREQRIAALQAARPEIGADELLRLIDKSVDHKPPPR